MAEPLCVEDFNRRLTTLVLAAESSFALAVSGGPDSMAMASLCSSWSQFFRKTARIPVLVVDHGLRVESGREARNVLSCLAALPGLEPCLLTLDLDRPTSGVMEKARAGRYEAIARHCAAHGIPYLMLAHHLDDQAETVLMRLAKGSGLDGLCGMRAVQKYDERLTLVRPFLDVPKDRLVATCESLGVSYVTDPSNSQEAYLRPRLRRVSGLLAREGLSAARLGVTAGRLARARAALDQIADRVFVQAVRATDSVFIRLDRRLLLDWPEEIRLRVVLRALSRLSPGFCASDIRIESLEKIVEGLFSEQAFRRQTLGGFLFSRKGVDIVLEREGVTLVSCQAP